MPQPPTSAVGVTGPATIWRPCLWCRITRPGEAPYLVAVQVENSDGICEACTDAMRAGIRARAQVAANVRATSPRVLRWKEARQAGVAAGPRQPDCTVEAQPEEHSDLDAPGETPGPPNTLRTFLSDNWATLILVGTVLVLAAVHTFMVAR